MPVPHRRQPPSRIAFLVAQFPILSQTFVIDQIASLVAAGFDVRIFAGHRATSGLVHAHARALMERATFAAAAPTWRLARLLPVRWRERWRERLLDGLRRRALTSADLVVCHFGDVGLAAVAANGRRSAVAAGRRRSAPVWTIFHGWDVSAFLRRRGADVYAPLFAAGDRFLAVSEGWTAKLRALGCPADRIALLRMGVDVDAIRFAPRALVPGETIELLTVGRLVEKKGTEVSLRALARLRDDAHGLDWRFTIAGDGPLRDHLEALATALGLADRVSFSGAVPGDEVRRLLARAHVFLLPSVTSATEDMEGIPVALMEAMAAGVSVLSTVHSGIPELIAHGVSGLLAPERDIGALAANLRTIAGDEVGRRAMLVAARATVEHEFNQGRIATRFADQIAARLREGTRG